MLVGTGIAGIMAETVGLRATLFTAVGFQVVAGLWLLVSPIFKLRTLPPPIDDARAIEA